MFAQRLPAAMPAATEALRKPDVSSCGCRSISSVSHTASFVEPENTRVGNITCVTDASTGGSVPCSGGGGAEWVMHMPIDGALEHLTEKMLHHVLTRTVETVSVVPPSYVTVRILDGSSGEMPIIAECCIGFCNVDRFRDFLHRHVEGGQDASFCARVMTTARKAAVAEQSKEPEPLPSVRGDGTDSGGNDIVNPAFAGLYRVIKRRGTCAPMTVRSQIDKKADWVRLLNRRETLALRSYLEGCLRRGQEVTWDEFAKHVPAATNPGRSAPVSQSSLFLKSAVSRGGSLDSRRSGDASVLTTTGVPFDDSKLWSGRGRQSRSLELSAMTSGRRRSNTERLAGDDLRGKTAGRRASESLAAAKMGTQRGLNPPRAHSTGASTARTQRAPPRQLVKDRSVVADTSVRTKALCDQIHPSDNFTPANRTLIEPSRGRTVVVGSQNETYRSQDDGRVEGANKEQPQIVDTWVDQLGSDTHLRDDKSSPKSRVLSAPLLSAIAPMRSTMSAATPMYPRLSSPTTAPVLPGAMQQMPRSSPMNSRSSLFSPSFTAVLPPINLYPFMKAVLMPSPMGLVYQKIP